MGVFLGDLSFIKLFLVRVMVDTRVPVYCRAPYTHIIYIQSHAQPANLPAYIFFYD